MVSVCMCAIIHVQDVHLLTRPPLFEFPHLIFAFAPKTTDLFKRIYAFELKTHISKPLSATYLQHIKPDLAICEGLKTTEKVFLALTPLVRHSETRVVTLILSDSRHDRDTQQIENDKGAEVSGLPL